MTDESVAEIVTHREQDGVSEPEARPFLKWAGGKSQLLSDLHQYVPKCFKRYWEPFLGGGALFFSTAKASAVISDINEDLIATYKVVQGDVEGLITELHQHLYDRDYFYSVRDWDRQEGFNECSAVKRAGRFIYLNRTCFNGLHRVNSKGYFNVPFGRYSNPKIVDADNLRRCSRALRNADIRVASYLSIESEVEKGDFVYFDPPYVPVSVTSSFTSYTKDGFGFEDQIALRDVCQRLADKGAFVLLSNSASPFVEALYEGFKINRVEATRAINAKADKRGPIEELIITSY